MVYSSVVEMACCSNEEEQVCSSEEEQANLTLGRCFGGQSLQVTIEVRLIEV